MGNQGHANEGTRLMREWVQAGALGAVREVHHWTNRPIWPQGIGRPDHSKSLPITILVNLLMMMPAVGLHPELAQHENTHSFLDRDRET